MKCELRTTPDLPASLQSLADFAFTSPANPEHQKGEPVPGARDRVTADRLSALRTEYKVTPRAFKTGDVPRLYYGSEGYRFRVTEFDPAPLEDLLDWANTHFGSGPDGWRLSGRLFYPEEGYLGWHSNYNRPGQRIYVAYSWAGDSGFAYTGDHGKVKYQKDPQGWSIRLFDTSQLYPWHAVYGGTGRFSIGLRLKQDEDKDWTPAYAARS